MGVYLRHRSRPWRATLLEVPEEDYEAPDWLPGLVDELMEPEHEPEAAAALPRRNAPRPIPEGRSEDDEAAAADERPPARDSCREEPRPRLRPVWRPTSPPGGLAGGTRAADKQFYKNLLSQQEENIALERECLTVKLEVAEEEQEAARKVSDAADTIKEHCAALFNRMGQVLRRSPDP